MIFVNIALLITGEWFVPGEFGRLNSVCVCVCVCVCACVFFPLVVVAAIFWCRFMNKHTWVHIFSFVMDAVLCVSFKLN